MVLVTAALTSAAFGTGVIMGLALGASTVACARACREARRAGVEEMPPRPGPEAERKNSPGRLAGRSSSRSLKNPRVGGRDVIRCAGVGKP